MNLCPICGITDLQLMLGCLTLGLMLGRMSARFSARRVDVARVE